MINISTYEKINTYGLELDIVIEAKLKEQAMFKRWLKENIYTKTPLFVRPFFYFFYRYIIRLGFLDGWRGLQWNFLQGLWYRFLVDAKIYEVESKIKDAKDKCLAVETVVIAEWGLKPPRAN